MYLKLIYEEQYMKDRNKFSTNKMGNCSSGQDSQLRMLSEPKYRIAQNVPFLKTFLCLWKVKCHMWHLCNHLGKPAFQSGSILHFVFILLDISISFMAKFAADKLECVLFGISWLKIAETWKLTRPTIICSNSTVIDSNMFKINNVFGHIRV